MGITFGSWFGLKLQILTLHEAAIVSVLVVHCFSGLPRCNMKTNRSVVRCLATLAKPHSPPGQCSCSSFYSRIIHTTRSPPVPLPADIRLERWLALRHSDHTYLSARLPACSWIAFPIAAGKAFEDRSLILLPNPDVRRSSCPAPPAFRSPHYHP